MVSDSSEFSQFDIEDDNDELEMSQASIEDKKSAQNINNLKICANKPIIKAAKSKSAASKDSKFAFLINKKVKQQQTKSISPLAIENKNVLSSKTSSKSNTPRKEIKIHDQDKETTQKEWLAQNQIIHQEEQQMINNSDENNDEDSGDESYIQQEDDAEAVQSEIEQQNSYSSTSEDEQKECIDQQPGFLSEIHKNNTQHLREQRKKGNVVKKNNNSNQHSDEKALNKMKQEVERRRREVRELKKALHEQSLQLDEQKDEIEELQCEVQKYKVVSSKKSKRAEEETFKSFTLLQQEIKQQQTNNNETTDLQESLTQTTLNEGSFQEGDGVDCILRTTLFDIVHKVKFEDREFKVKWLKRADGFQPADSYVNGEELLLHSKDLLLEYYKSQATFLI